MKKVILYISGIGALEAGIYGGVIDGKHVFLKEDDATERKPLELDEAGATAKLAELKKLFATAVFELKDAEVAPAPEVSN